MYCTTQAARKGVCGHAAPMAALAAALAALTLAFAMLVAPTAAWADTATSGDCSAAGDGSVIWAITQNNDDAANPTYTLTISGNGAMVDWCEHRSSGDNACGTANASVDTCDNPKCERNRPWLPYLDSITKVEMGEGITRLGSETLLRAAGAESIELPASLEEIGFGSLAGMTSLKSVAIPDAVTKIETSAFYGDAALENLAFSSAGNLKSIGNFAFSGLAISGEVDLPGGLETVGRSLFERCNNIEKLVIPESVNEYSVSDSGTNNLFNAVSNPSLKKVVIESSANLPANMFYSLGSLEEVEITGDVKSIGNAAFWKCTNLKRVAGAEGVETFGSQAFRYDSSLTDIGFNSAKNIGSWCFAASGLVSVDIPAAEQIGSAAFNGCSSLASMTLGGSPAISDGIISGDYLLTTVDLTKATSLSGISSGAFVYWQNSEDNSRADQFTAFYLTDDATVAAAEPGFRKNGTHAIFVSTNGGVLNGATAVKASLATPVKDGYTFAGWYSDNSYKKEYAGGVVTSDITNLWTDYHAYAKWNSEISFDANGGEGDMGKQAILEGASAKLTANAFTRADNGVAYKFVGWNTRADGSGDSYADEADITPVGNMTLYAQWAKEDQYAVSAILDQTYAGKPIVPSVVVKRGSDTIASSQYTVTCENNIDVGTATATVTINPGAANEKVFKLDFQIVKDEKPTVEISLPSDLIYSANAKVVTAIAKTSAGNEISDANISVKYYTDEDCTLGETADAPKNVGNYWVKVELAESANYASASSTASFTIVRASSETRPTAEGTQDNPVEATYGDTVDFTVKIAAKADSGVSTLALTNEEAVPQGEVGFFYNGKKVGDFVPYNAEQGTATLTYDTADKIISAGQTQELTVKFGGSDTLMPSESTFYVKINKANQNLHFESTEKEQHIGKVENALIDAIGDVTLESDNTSVAVVNAGEVSIMAPGQATITARAAGDDWYNAGMATYALAATDHEFGGAPAGDERGHWQKCSIDGCQATSTISAHQFGAWQVTPASADADGKRVRSCDACGYSEEQIIPKGDAPLFESPAVSVHVSSAGIAGPQLQNVADGDKVAYAVLSVDAKQTVATIDADTGKVYPQAPGKAKVTASIMRGTDQFVATYELTVTDHEFDEGVITTQPTCTVPGVKTFICKYEGCSESKTEEVAALGHDWANDTTVDTAATCTVNGAKSIHCTRCNEIKPGSEQVIPVTGHDLAYKHDADGHWQECSKCDYTTEREAHHFGEWTVTAKATAAVAGEKQRTCDACGYTVVEKIAATGNQNGNSVSGDNGNGAAGANDAVDGQIGLAATGDNTMTAAGVVAAMGAIALVIVVVAARRRRAGN